MSTRRALGMDEAKQLLENFAAGRLDARAFQARYLAVRRDMRDRGEPWAGEAGRLVVPRGTPDLAAIFDPAECFDPDVAPGEPTAAFTLDGARFRAGVLDLHERPHALSVERT